MKVFLLSRNPMQGLTRIDIFGSLTHLLMAVGEPDLGLTCLVCFRFCLNLSKGWSVVSNEVDIDQKPSYFKPFPKIKLHIVQKKQSLRWISLLVLSNDWTVLPLWTGPRKTYQETLSLRHTKKEKEKKLKNHEHRSLIVPWSTLSWNTSLAKNVNF